MQPPQQGFDIAGAHLLRQARAPLPIRSRIGAITITAAAHLVVIIALVEGLEQARIIHPPEIAVQFSPETARPKPPPPSSPLVPAVIDASAQDLPPPQINLSAPPGPAAGPAPPMYLPSPPNANYGTSNAEPTWETALLSRVEQAKHAPVSASGGNVRGVVMLRFKMDRDGKVLEAKIERSSGNDTLDQEALAGLQRAQPLPAPPAELPGATLELIVPVDFL
jgi:protein TonB